MGLAANIAKQFRDTHFGDNSTGTNVKTVLSDITWQQAVTQVSSLNTIAKLVFHINYYVSGVMNVLKGGELVIRDRYSYDLPPINNQEDWEQLRNKALIEAEEFANLLEQLPDERYFETFVDEKYGNYYRNITGIIEHTSYHLGQISLIKKMLNNNS